MLLSIYFIIPFILAVGILIFFLLKFKKKADVYEVPKGRFVYGDLVSEGKVLVSNKYGLSGKPDRVIESKGLLIPYEFKSGSAGETPWEPHKIQMGVYFLILKELYPQKEIQYGVIRYRNRAFYVENTQELRDRVLQRTEILRRVKGVPSRNHNTPNKCAPCKYRSICRERLR
jgi:CRISPR-associated exonuclease Cas4